jgi:hypothetical protein
MPAMMSSDVAPTARVRMPLSDPHDRVLVRHMLTLTPTERLQSVSSYWPLIRVGLVRRAAVGAARP